MKCEWNIFWKICWIPSWYFRTCWMVELLERCVNVHWFSTPWNSKKKSPLEYTRSFLNVFCHTTLFAKGCLIISFVPHAKRCCFFAECRVGIVPLGDVVTSVGFGAWKSSPKITEFTLVLKVILCIFKIPDLPVPYIFGTKLPGKPIYQVTRPPVPNI